MLWWPSTIKVFHCCFITVILLLLWIIMQISDMWPLWGSWPTGWELLLQSFVNTIFKPAPLSVLSPYSPPPFQFDGNLFHQKLLSIRNFFLLSPLNWAAELPSWQSLISLRIRIWASGPIFYKPSVAAYTSNPSIGEGDENSILGIPGQPPLF